MELSQDPKIAQLRAEAMNALRAAETALYAYWTACEVGDERTYGYNLYAIVLRAPREARL